MHAKYTHYAILKMTIECREKEKECQSAQPNRVPFNLLTDKYSKNVLIRETRFLLHFDLSFFSICLENVHCVCVREKEIAVLLIFMTNLTAPSEFFFSLFFAK